MFAGDFLRNLKKLNKNLTVFSSDERYPAGLYLMFYGEPVHICGVDRNHVPEFTVTDSKGHIVKSGWRRVLSILISKGLIDKFKAQRTFHTELKKANRHINVEQDATMRAMLDITNRRMEQRDGAVTTKEGKLVPVYRREDFLNWREVMNAARR